MKLSHLADTGPPLVTVWDGYITQATLFYRSFSDKSDEEERVIGETLVESIVITRASE